MMAASFHGVWIVTMVAGFSLRPVNYAFWVMCGTPFILLLGNLPTPAKPALQWLGS
jgi:hypothetical protein